MTIVVPQNGLHLAPALCSQGMENWERTVRSRLSAWTGSCSAEWSMRNAYVAVSTTNRELERTLRARNAHQTNRTCNQTASARRFALANSKCGTEKRLRKCQPGQVRTANGQCLCPLGFDLWGGKVRPEMRPGADTCRAERQMLSKARLAFWGDRRTKVAWRNGDFDNLALPARRPRRLDTITLSSPRAISSPLLMLWTALRQAISMFAADRMEESHGSSGHDRIGHRQIDLSSARS